MTHEERERVEQLLRRINKITAPHRYGNIIPIRDLDALCDAQIDVELWLKSAAQGKKEDKMEPLKIIVPGSLNEYLDYCRENRERPHKDSRCIMRPEQAEGLIVGEVVKIGTWHFHDARYEALDVLKARQYMLSPRPEKAKEAAQGIAKSLRERQK